MVRFEFVYLKDVFGEGRSRKRRAVGASRGWRGPPREGGLWRAAEQPAGLGGPGHGRALGQPGCSALWERKSGPNWADGASSAEDPEGQQAGRGKRCCTLPCGRAHFRSGL